MSNELLVLRAMQTFNKLDAFGKKCTAHSLGVKSYDDLATAFRAQDDWTLEHVTIEEMEFDLRTK